jgi:hypothetical protein
MDSSKGEDAGEKTEDNKRLLKDAAQAAVKLVEIRAQALKALPTKLFFRHGAASEHSRFLAQQFYTQLKQAPGIHFTVYGKPITAWPPLVEIVGDHDADESASMRNRTRKIWQTISIPVVEMAHETFQAYREYLGHQAPKKLTGTSLRQWLRDKGVNAKISSEDDMSFLLFRYTKGLEDALDWEGCYVCHLGDGSVVAWEKQKAGERILPFPAEDKFLKQLKSSKVIRGTNRPGPSDFMQHAKMASELNEVKLQQLLLTDNCLQKIANMEQDKWLQWLAHLWTWLSKNQLYKVDVMTSHTLDAIHLLPVFDPMNRVEYSTKLKDLKIIRKPLSERRHAVLLQPENIDLLGTLCAFGVLCVADLQLQSIFGLQPHEGSGPQMAKFLHTSNCEGIIAALTSRLTQIDATSIDASNRRNLLTLIILQCQGVSARHGVSQLQLQLRTICEKVPMFQVCGQRSPNKHLVLKTVRAADTLYVLPTDLPEGIRSILVGCALPNVLMELSDVREFAIKTLNVKSMELAGFLTQVVFPAICEKRLLPAQIEKIVYEISSLQTTKPALFDTVHPYISDLAFVRTKYGVLKPRECVLAGHINQYFPHLKDQILNVVADDCNVEPALQLFGLRTHLSPDEVLLAAKNVGRSKTPVISAGFLFVYVAFHYLKTEELVSNYANTVKLCSGSDLFANLKCVHWLPVQPKPLHWSGRWCGSGTSLAAASENELWAFRAKDYVGNVRLVIDLRIGGKVISKDQNCPYREHQKTAPEYSAAINALLGIKTLCDITNAVLIEGIHGLVEDSQNGQMGGAAGEKDTKKPKGRMGMFGKHKDKDGNAHEKGAKKKKTMLGGKGVLGGHKKEDEEKDLQLDIVMLKRYRKLRCKDGTALALLKVKHDGKWVWSPVAKEFFALDRVTKDERATDIKHFILKLPEAWESLQCFHTVSNVLDKDTVFLILKEIGQRAETTSNHEALIGPWKSCIECLVVGKQVLTDDEVVQVYAPNTKGILTPVQKLFDNDRTSVCTRWTDDRGVVRLMPDADHTSVAPGFCELAPKRSLPPGTSTLLKVAKLSDLCVKKFRDTSRYQTLDFHEVKANQNKRSRRLEGEPQTVQAFFQKWMQEANSAGATHVKACLDPSARKTIGSERIHNSIRLLDTSVYLWSDKQLSASKWDALLKLHPDWGWLLLAAPNVTVSSGTHVCFLDLQRGFVNDNDEHRWPHLLCKFQYDLLFKYFPSEFYRFGQYYDEANACMPGTLIRLDWSMVRYSLGHSERNDSAPSDAAYMNYKKQMFEMSSMEAIPVFGLFFTNLKKVQFSEMSPDVEDPAPVPDAEFTFTRLQQPASGGIQKLSVSVLTANCSRSDQDWVMVRDGSVCVAHFVSLGCPPYVPAAYADFGDFGGRVIDQTQANGAKKQDVLQNCVVKYCEESGDDIVPAAVATPGEGCQREERGRSLAVCWAKILAWKVAQAAGDVAVLRTQSMRVCTAVSVDSVAFCKETAAQEVKKRLKLPGGKTLDMCQQLPDHVSGMHEFLSIGGSTNSINVQSRALLVQEAKAWLYNKASVLEVPFWLNELLDLTLPPLDQSRWINPYGEKSLVYDQFIALAQARDQRKLFANLQLWAYFQMPKLSLAQCPLQTEDESFATRKKRHDVWFCSSSDRKVVKLAKPSNRVVAAGCLLSDGFPHCLDPNTCSTPRPVEFRKRFGLKSPKSVADVAECSQDIDAREFWKFLAKESEAKARYGGGGAAGASASAGRASNSAGRGFAAVEDLSGLEGRLDVLVSVPSAGLQKQVPFMEYCALERTEVLKIDNALADIGCWFAMENMPCTCPVDGSGQQEGVFGCKPANRRAGAAASKRFYVGNSPMFVLRFLQKHKQQLKMTKEKSASLENLIIFLACYRLHHDHLKTLSEIELKELDGIMLKELPLVNVDGEMRTLAEITCVRDWRKSEKFAKLMRPHFPVYSNSHPVFQPLEQFCEMAGASQSRSPVGVFEKFAPEFRSSSVTDALVKQMLDIVVEYIREKNYGAGIFEKVAKLAIFSEGSGRIQDLFNEGEALVSLLGQVAAADDTAVAGVMSIPAGFFPFMKSTKSFASLKQLLRPEKLAPLAGNLLKLKKYENAFFETIDALHNAEIDKCAKHFAEMEVYPFDKKLRKISDVFSSSQSSLLGKSSLLLESTKRSANIERLLQKPPPITAVLQHLTSVCAQMGTAPGNENVNTRLSKLEHIYEHLRGQMTNGILQDPWNEAELGKLGNIKCILGLKGQLDFPSKFSVGRMIDQEPAQFAILSNIRTQELQPLWLAIGAKKTETNVKLPEAVQPSAFCSDLREDIDELDVEVPVLEKDGSPGNLLLHRLILVKHVPKAKALLRLVIKSADLHQAQAQLAEQTSGYLSANGPRLAVGTSGAGLFDTSIALGQQQSHQDRTMPCTKRKAIASTAPTPPTAPTALTAPRTSGRGQSSGGNSPPRNEAGLPQWYLQTNGRHPREAMNIIRNYIYTGDLPRDIGVELAHITLRAAENIGCDFIQEYMRQYLQGVPPEQLARRNPIALHHWEYPSYWDAKGAKGEFTEDFTELIDDPAMCTVLQHTMQACCVSCQKRYIVKSVKRIENSFLWRQFTAGRQGIRDNSKKNNWQAQIEDKMNFPYTQPMQKQNVERHQLDFTGCNEVYLFHGTKRNVVDIITKTEGFDQRVAANGLYGTGIYFAEQACKSNQYASDTGTKVMLYCRVLLGNAHIVTRRSPGSQKFTRPPNRRDSCIANPTGGHREFIVYERQLAYPEYLIEYQTS